MFDRPLNASLERSPLVIATFVRVGPLSDFKTALINSLIHTPETKSSALNISGKNTILTPQKVYLTT